MRSGEMPFWTKEESLRFSDAVSDKSLAFYAFEVLYWMGIRCGELMALTPSDFLMETSELRINKSYQRLHPGGVRADRQHGRLERHEQAGLHHGEADRDRDNGETIVADATGAARLHEGTGGAAPRRVRRR